MTDEAAIRRRIGVLYGYLDRLEQRRVQLSDEELDYLHDRERAWRAELEDLKERQRRELQAWTEAWSAEDEKEEGDGDRR